MVGNRVCAKARTHGALKDVRPVVSRLLPQRKDILLLCSDGLSNKLPADVLLKIVDENRNDLKTARSFLTHEANERGGEDNITVILARLAGGDLPEASEEAIKIETPDFGGVSNDALRNAPDKFYNRRGFRLGGVSVRTNFS
jgi:serine/threonine protein phosphatase PrpC